jgi:hypothetical protein
LRAKREPKVTEAAMIQNTGADPMAALAAPKNKGMPTLEALIVIRRKAKACP